MNLNFHIFFPHIRSNEQMFLMSIFFVIFFLWIQKEKENFAAAFRVCLCCMLTLDYIIFTHAYMPGEME